MEPVELPDSLQKFFKVALGMEWPEANEQGLKMISAAWSSFASDLRTLEGGLESGARGVDGALDGEFGEALRGFVGGDLVAGVAELATIADSLSKAAKRGFADVQKAKILMSVMAALALASIIELLLSLWFAWLAPVVAAAARVTIMMVLRALQRALASITVRQLGRAAVTLTVDMAKFGAFGAVLMGSLDAIIQGFQMTGKDPLREEFDSRSVINSVVSGAIGGAGAGVSHSLAKLVRSGGRDAREKLAELVPAAGIPRHLVMLGQGLYAVGQMVAVLATTPLVNVATGSHEAFWGGFLGAVGALGGGKTGEGAPGSGGKAGDLSKVSVDPGRVERVLAEIQKSEKPEKSEKESAGEKKLTGAGWILTESVEDPVPAYSAEPGTGEKTVVTASEPGEVSKEQSKRSITDGADVELGTFFGAPVTTNLASGHEISALESPARSVGPSDVGIENGVVGTAPDSNHGQLHASPVVRQASPEVVGKGVSDSSVTTASGVLGERARSNPGSAARAGETGSHDPAGSVQAAPKSGASRVAGGTGEVAARPAESVARASADAGQTGRAGWPVVARPIPVSSAPPSHIGDAERPSSRMESEGRPERAREVSATSVTTTAAGPARGDSPVTGQATPETGSDRTVRSPSDENAGQRAVEVAGLVASADPVRPGAARQPEVVRPGGLRVEDPAVHPRPVLSTENRGPLRIAVSGDTRDTAKSEDFDDSVQDSVVSEPVSDMASVESPPGGATPDAVSVPGGEWSRLGDGWVESGEGVVLQTSGGHVDVPSGSLGILDGEGELRLVLFESGESFDRGWDGTWSGPRTETGQVRVRAMDRFDLAQLAAGALDKARWDVDAESLARIGQVDEVVWEPDGGGGRQVLMLRQTLDEEGKMLPSPVSWVRDGADGWVRRGVEAVELEAWLAGANRSFRAAGALFDIDARSEAGMPPERRLTGMGIAELQDLYKSGVTADVFAAVHEIIRRERGISLRWTQVESVFRAVAGLDLGLKEEGLQMGAGEGKSWTFFAASAVGAGLMSSWQQREAEAGRDVGRAGVQMTTTRDELASREMADYQHLVGLLGGDVHRLNSDTPAPAAELFKPTIYVGSVGEVAFTFLKRDVLPGQSQPGEKVSLFFLGDEFDEMKKYSSGQFIFSEGVQAEATPEVLAQVGWAHRLVTDGLEDGSLSEADFGRTKGQKGGAAQLTERGMEKVESSSGRTLSEGEVRRINMAAAARWEYKYKRHFEIHDGKIAIIDQVTGAVLSDPKTSSESRWNGGLAQAIEYAHGLTVRGDSDAGGTKQLTVGELLTRPEYVWKAAASGTAVGHGDVFASVGMSSTVREIPLYHQSRLVRLPDMIAPDQEAKLRRIAEDTTAELVGGRWPQAIISPYNDEVAPISALLREKGIEHVAVDALWMLEQGADREGAFQRIVDQAGAEGKVLVVNASGGRGTDIKLAAGKLEEMGLLVRITAHSEISQDVDIQAAKRAARSGRLGKVVVYSSPDDNLFALSENPDVRQAIIQYTGAVGRNDAEGAAVGEQRMRDLVPRIQPGPGQSTPTGSRRAGSPDIEGQPRSEEHPPEHPTYDVIGTRPNAPPHDAAAPVGTIRDAPDPQPPEAPFRVGSGRTSAIEHLLGAQAGPSSSASPVRRARHDEDEGDDSLGRDWTPWMFTGLAPDGSLLDEQGESTRQLPSATKAMLPDHILRAWDGARKSIEASKLPAALVDSLAARARQIASDHIQMQTYVGEINLERQALISRDNVLRTLIVAQRIRDHNQGLEPARAEHNINELARHLAAAVGAPRIRGARGARGDDMDPAQAEGQAPSDPETGFDERRWQEMLGTHGERWGMAFATPERGGLRKEDYSRFDVHSMAEVADTTYEDDFGDRQQTTYSPAPWSPELQPGRQRPFFLTLDAEGDSFLVPSGADGVEQAMSPEETARMVDAEPWFRTLKSAKIRPLLVVVVDNSGISGEATGRLTERFLSELDALSGPWLSIYTEGRAEFESGDVGLPKSLQMRNGYGFRESGLPDLSEVEHFSSGSVFGLVGDEIDVKILQGFAENVVSGKNVPKKWEERDPLVVVVDSKDGSFGRVVLAGNSLIELGGDRVARVLLSDPHFLESVREEPDRDLLLVAHRGGVQIKRGAMGFDFAGALRREGFFNRVFSPDGAVAIGREGLAVDRGVEWNEVSVLREGDVAVEYLRNREGLIVASFVRFAGDQEYLYTVRDWAWEVTAETLGKYVIHDDSGHRDQGSPWRDSFPLFHLSGSDREGHLAIRRDAVEVRLEDGDLARLVTVNPEWRAALSRDSDATRSRPIVFASVNGKAFVGERYCRELMTGGYYRRVYRPTGTLGFLGGGRLRADFDAFDELAPLDPQAENASSFPLFNTIMGTFGEAFPSRRSDASIWSLAARQNNPIRRQYYLRTERVRVRGGASASTLVPYINPAAVEQKRTWSVESHGTNKSLFFSLKTNFPGELGDEVELGAGPALSVISGTSLFKGAYSGAGGSLQVLACNTNRYDGGPPVLNEIRELWTQSSGGVSSTAYGYSNSNSTHPYNGANLLLGPGDYAEARGESTASPGIRLDELDPGRIEDLWIEFPTKIRDLVAIGKNSPAIEAAAGPSSPSSPVEQVENLARAFARAAAWKAKNLVEWQQATSLTFTGFAQRGRLGSAYAKNTGRLRARSVARVFVAAMAEEMRQLSRLGFEVRPGQIKLALRREVAPAGLASGVAIAVGLPEQDLGSSALSKLRRRQFERDPMLSPADLDDLEVSLVGLPLDRWVFDDAGLVALGRVVPVARGVVRVRMGAVLGAAGSEVVEAFGWLEREAGVFGVGVEGHRVPSIAEVRYALVAGGWNRLDRIRLFVCGQAGLAELADQVAGRWGVGVFFPEKDAYLGLRGGPAVTVAEVVHDPVSLAPAVRPVEGGGWGARWPDDSQEVVSYALSAPAGRPTLGLAQPARLGPEAPPSGTAGGSRLLQDSVHEYAESAGSLGGIGFDSGMGADGVRWRDLHESLPVATGTKPFHVYAVGAGDGFIIDGVTVDGATAAYRVGSAPFFHARMGDPEVPVVLMGAETAQAGRDFAEALRGDGPLRPVFVRLAQMEVDSEGRAALARAETLLQVAEPRPDDLAILSLHFFDGRRYGSALATPARRSPVDMSGLGASEHVLRVVSTAHEDTNGQVWHSVAPAPWASAMVEGRVSPEFLHLDASAHGMLVALPGGRQIEVEPAGLALALTRLAWMQDVITREVRPPLIVLTQAPAGGPGPTATAKFLRAFRELTGPWLAYELEAPHGFRTAQVDNVVLSIELSVPERTRIDESGLPSIADVVHVASDSVFGMAAGEQDFRDFEGFAAVVSDGARLAGLFAEFAGREPLVVLASSPDGMFARYRWSSGHVMEIDGEQLGRVWLEDNRFREALEADRDRPVLVVGNRAGALNNFGGLAFDFARALHSRGFFPPVYAPDRSLTIGSDPAATLAGVRLEEASGLRAGDVLTETLRDRDGEAIGLFVRFEGDDGYLEAATRWASTTTPEILGTYIRRGPDDVSRREYSPWLTPPFFLFGGTGTRDSYQIVLKDGSHLAIEMESLSRILRTDPDLRVALDRGHPVRRVRPLFFAALNERAVGIEALSRGLLLGGYSRPLYTPTGEIGLSADGTLRLEGGSFSRYDPPQPSGHDVVTRPKVNAELGTYGQYFPLGESDAHLMSMVARNTTALRRLYYLSISRFVDDEGNEHALHVPYTSPNLGSPLPEWDIDGHGEGNKGILFALKTDFLYDYGDMADLGPEASAAVIHGSRMFLKENRDRAVSLSLANCWVNLLDADAKNAKAHGIQLEFRRLHTRDSSVIGATSRVKLANDTGVRIVDGGGLIAEALQIGEVPASFRPFKDFAVNEISRVLVPFAFQDSAVESVDSEVAAKLDVLTRQVVAAAMWRLRTGMPPEDMPRLVVRGIGGEQEWGPGQALVAGRTRAERVAGILADKMASEMGWFVERGLEIRPHHVTMDVRGEVAVGQADGGSVVEVELAELELGEEAIGGLLEGPSEEAIRKFDSAFANLIPGEPAIDTQGRVVLGRSVPAAARMDRVRNGVVLGDVESLPGRAFTWLEHEPGVFSVNVTDHRVPSLQTVLIALTAGRWNRRDNIRVIVCRGESPASPVNELGDLARALVARIGGGWVDVSSVGLQMGAPGPGPALRVAELGFDASGRPLTFARVDGEGWDRHTAEGQFLAGRYVLPAPAQAPRLGLVQPIYLGPDQSGPAPAERSAEVAEHQDSVKTADGPAGFSGPGYLRRSKAMGFATQVTRTENIGQVLEALKARSSRAPEDAEIKTVEHELGSNLGSFVGGGRVLEFGGEQILVEAAFRWPGAKVAGEVEEKVVGPATRKAGESAQANTSTALKPQATFVAFLPGVPGAFITAVLNVPTALATARSHSQTSGRSVEAGVSLRPVTGTGQGYRGTRRVNASVYLTLTPLDRHGNPSGTKLIFDPKRSQAEKIRATLSVPVGLGEVEQQVPLPRRLPPSLPEAVAVKSTVTGRFIGKQVPLKAGVRRGIFEQVHAVLGELEVESQRVLREFLHTNTMGARLPAMAISAEQAASPGAGGSTGGWVTSPPLRLRDKWFKRPFSSRSQRIQTRAVARRIAYIETLEGARFDVRETESGSKSASTTSGLNSSGSVGGGPGFDIAGAVTVGGGPIAGGGAGRGRSTVHGQDQTLSVDKRYDGGVVRYRTVYDLEIRASGRPAVVFAEALEATQLSELEDALNAGLVPGAPAAPKADRAALDPQEASGRLGAILRASAASLPGHSRWVWRNARLVTAFDEPDLRKGMNAGLERQRQRADAINERVLEESLTRNGRDLILGYPMAVVLAPEQGRAHEYHTGFTIEPRLVGELQPLGPAKSGVGKIELRDVERRDSVRSESSSFFGGLRERVYVSPAGEMLMLTATQKAGYARSTSAGLTSGVDLLSSSVVGTALDEAGVTGSLPRQRYSATIALEVKGGFWSRLNDMVRKMTFGKRGRHLPKRSDLTIIDPLAKSDGREPGKLTVDVVVELTEAEAQALSMVAADESFALSSQPLNRNRHLRHRGSRILDGVPLSWVRGMESVRELFRVTALAASGGDPALTFEDGENSQLIEQAISPESVRRDRRVLTRPIRIDGLRWMTRSRELRGSAAVTYRLRNPRVIGRYHQESERAVTGTNTTSSETTRTLSFGNEGEITFFPISDTSAHAPGTTVSGVVPMLAELNFWTKNFSKKRASSATVSSTRSLVGEPVDGYLIEADLEATVAVETTKRSPLDWWHLRRRPRPVNHATRRTVLPGAVQAGVTAEQLHAIRAEQAVDDARSAEASTPSVPDRPEGGFGTRAAGTESGGVNWADGVTDPIDLSDRIDDLYDAFEAGTSVEEAEGLRSDVAAVSGHDNHRAITEFLSNLQAPLADLANGGGRVTLRLEDGRWSGSTYDLVVGVTAKKVTSRGVTHGRLTTGWAVSTKTTVVRGVRRVVAELMTLFSIGPMFQADSEIAKAEQTPGRHGAPFGLVGHGVVHVVEWLNKAKNRTKTRADEVVQSETVSGALAAYDVDLEFDLRFERHGERIAGITVERTVRSQAPMEDRVNGEGGLRPGETVTRPAEEASEEKIERWLNSPGAEQLPTDPAQYRATKFAGDTKHLIAAAESILEASTGRPLDSETRASLHAQLTSSGLLAFPRTSEAVELILPHRLDTRLTLYRKLDGAGTLESASGRIVLGGGAESTRGQERESSVETAQAFLSAPVTYVGVPQAPGHTTYEEGRRPFGSITNVLYLFQGHGGVGSEHAHATASQSGGAALPVTEEGPSSPITSTWSYPTQFRLVAEPVTSMTSREVRVLDVDFDKGYVVRRSDRNDRLPEPLVRSVREFAQRDHEWAAARKKARAVPNTGTTAAEKRAAAKFSKATVAYERALETARADPSLRGGRPAVRVELPEKAARVPMEGRNDLLKVARRLLAEHESGRTPRVRYRVLGDPGTAARKFLAVFMPDFDSVLYLAQTSVPAARRLGREELGLAEAPQVVAGTGRPVIEVWVDDEGPRGNDRAATGAGAARRELTTIVEEDEQDPSAAGSTLSHVEEWDGSMGRDWTPWKFTGLASDGSVADESGASTGELPSATKELLPVEILQAWDEARRLLDASKLPAALVDSLAVRARQLASDHIQTQMLVGEVDPEQRALLSRDHVLRTIVVAQRVRDHVRGLEPGVAERKVDELSRQLAGLVGARRTRGGRGARDDDPEMGGHHQDGEGGAFERAVEFLAGSGFGLDMSGSDSLFDGVPNEHETGDTGALADSSEQPGSGERQHDFPALSPADRGQTFDVGTALRHEFEAVALQQRSEGRQNPGRGRFQDVGEQRENLVGEAEARLTTTNAVKNVVAGFLWEGGAEEDASRLAEKLAEVLEARDGGRNANSGSAGFMRRDVSRFGGGESSRSAPRVPPDTASSPHERPSSGPSRSFINAMDGVRTSGAGFTSDGEPLTTAAVAGRRPTQIPPMTEAAYAYARSLRCGINKC
ncbi:WXG100-like domain-containing protein, partial [Amycolatopsis thailandensis]|uniref:WXG100-like domain-containing protein n=1 Tax=Amycolatopsis thailandensis TaxID=589330 RepID=UPI00363941DD